MTLWRCKGCGVLALRDESLDDDGSLRQEYHDHPDGSGWPMERWTAAGLANVSGPDGW